MCLQDMCIALPNHASKCNLILNIYMLTNETKSFRLQRKVRADLTYFNTETSK